MNGLVLCIFSADKIIEPAFIKPKKARRLKKANTGNNKYAGVAEC